MTEANMNMKETFSLNMQVKQISKIDSISDLPKIASLLLLRPNSVLPSFFYTDTDKRR